MSNAKALGGNRIFNVNKVSGKAILEKSVLTQVWV